MRRSLITDFKNIQKRSGHRNPVMTLKDLSVETGISYQKLRRLAKNDDFNLESTKLGSCYYYDKEKLERWARILKT